MHGGETGQTVWSLIRLVTFPLRTLPPASIAVKGEGGIPIETPTMEGAYRKNNG